MATTEGRTRGRRAAGVREIARLTGYSPSYVCIVRKGERKARPLRERMRELGLRFRPAARRAAKEGGAR